DHLANTVGRADALVALGKLFTRFDILFVFIHQTAAQATAHAGDLRRVERDPLHLRHLDRDWAEVCQEGAATAQDTARPKPTKQLGDITRANLTHLDLHVEVLAEFGDQLG